MELDAALLVHQELWEARRVPIRERNRGIMSGEASSLLSAACAIAEILSDPLTRLRFASPLAPIMNPRRGAPRTQVALLT
jgi:hypothetical protein